MKNICLYFQVHQPFRLKRYRFFDVGKDHYYYDDYLNKHILKKVANRCYLPTNELLYSLLTEFKGQFKVSFSLTGIFLDQLELYAPDVIASFKKLAGTGHVEFLSETYSHSLAAIGSPEEFVAQVDLHKRKIESLFGMTPAVFRNTELVYSDSIGEQVSKMGYKAMLAEGAKHVLGWKSPNFLYYNVIDPRLKVLLRNYKLSDDIAFRFSNRSWSEWPLKSETYHNWLKGTPANEDFVNLFMDYETFGEHQPIESGIHQFLDHLVRLIIKDPETGFALPGEIADTHQSVGPLSVPYPSSWADEERDLSAWLGNEMQKEAFKKLNSLRKLVIQANDPDLSRDWGYLQASDHLYYMSTKFFADQSVHNYFNPYNSPYDAFINYMNILSDFIIRLEKKTKRVVYKGIPIEELSGESLDEAISDYEGILKVLRQKKGSVKKAAGSKPVALVIPNTTKPKPGKKKKK
ncbi:MAG: glycoside hydrolase family 57 protein [Bacteroidia bacterium]|nr:glycoside hydrolase family 57 protein [Bacteroidia bacterium]